MGDITDKYRNGICDSLHDFKDIKEFYPKIFWIHKEYRNDNFNKLEDVISIAQNFNVPVIIHPSNYAADNYINQEFKKLVSLANKNCIP